MSRTDVSKETTTTRAQPVNRVDREGLCVLHWSKGSYVRIECRLSYTLSFASNTAVEPVSLTYINQNDLHTESNTNSTQLS